MIISIYEVNLFKAALAASAKDFVRYYLNGVLFTKGGFVIGANGHVLVKTKCSDYDGDDIIISMKKTIPAKTNNISIDMDTMVVSYQDSKHKEIGICRAKIVDYRYPDISKVIPEITDKKCENKIAFNPSLIYPIQEAGKFRGFRFSIKSCTDAIRFSPYEFSDERFAGVIMPLKYYGFYFLSDRNEL